jgi:superfamily II DNA or RNA helicase
MEITILDAIECEVSAPNGRRLVPCLSFESSYWQQGPYKKQRKSYMKQAFSFKGKTVWRFHTGLLPRVLAWCKENNVSVEVDGKEFKIKRQAKPNLDGITLRDDQLRLIDAACKRQRGVIHSVTGSGKTIMQLGILSCFPKHRALILAHTTAIVKQTFEKLKTYGFEDIEMFGGGISARKPTAQIAVSTMQTFIKIDPKDYVAFYDIVIIDESHHLQKLDSTYAKILGTMLSPMRLGFTATKRESMEAVLVNEGLLGPTLERVTIKEAAELGILATPKLKLIKAECSDNIMDIRNFQDTYEKVRVNGKLVNGDRLKAGVYTYGIVENIRRNRQIAEIVEGFVNKKMTTLIFVTHIAHGELLQEAIYKLIGYNTPFIRGNVSVDDREKVKAGLISKRIKVCIATTTWTEGVDVPSLDAVIMAGGGKSEIQTLQKLGRGLRKTKDKDTVIVVDFLDLKHFHLIRQTGERLSTYSDNDWL